jgi:hypothetical protein
MASSGDAIVRLRRIVGGTGGVVRMNSSNGSALL